MYEQLSKARVTLTELYNQQKMTTDILLQQQIGQQISMQSKRIDQLQEEENQWFQLSRPARDEVHRLTERARQLITQADQYTTTIDTSLNTVQDEPLELKLQYIEIKAVATSIVIILADWHASKAQLMTNVLAMLKVLAFDGPPTNPSA